MEVQLKVGQKVQWQGDFSVVDTLDGPCRTGQCVGTVVELGQDRTEGVTRVKWDTLCDWHNEEFIPEAERYTQWITTKQLLPVDPQKV